MRSDTTQLAGDFSGREFDAALLSDLPASVDPCGERGEFHTCVHAGPMFARPLALHTGERVLREERFRLRRSRTRQLTACMTNRCG